MPIALLAAVPEFWVAVALLLLAYAALIVFRKPLELLLGNVPIVGGYIVQGIEAGLATVTQWGLSWAKTGIDAVVQVVWVPIYNLAQLLAAVIAFAVAAATYLAALPATIGRLQASLIADIEALATSAIAQATKLANLVASLPTTIHAIAAALVAAAETTLRAEIAAAEATLGRAIDTARLDLGQAIDGAEAKAAAGLAALTGAVAADVTALRGIVDADVRGIEGELGQLHGLVDPLVAAGLLTLVPALATELETTIEECVTPTCGVITPQLSTLQAFLDAGTLALVGAVVAEAVANPQATAQATATVIGDVEGAASGLLTAFAGIRV